MTTQTIDDTFRMFFATCPGCGKPVKDNEDLHDTDFGAIWHSACWDNQNLDDTMRTRPARPAYGDFEGTGWIDG